MPVLAQGDSGVSDTVSITLDKVFEQDGTDVKIAIETMAGKGSEICFTFEQVNEVLEKSAHKDGGYDHRREARSF